MVELNYFSRIYIAGHYGLVGSALVRQFQKEGFNNLILRSRKELDLTLRNEVFKLFEETKPHFVIMAAAKVGGIIANMAEPVEFLLVNLKIQNNILEACNKFKVLKTIFLGSSCIYPRECSQPMLEDYFMNGPLEPTNMSYAVAKIAGIQLAQSLHKQYGLNVICPIPSNVYGPDDHFEFEKSHVLSALVRRFVEAKRGNISNITLLGTGTARREFLHVDDLANACIFLLKNYDSSEIINVGTGEDFSIQELAETIAKLTEFTGTITWDSQIPDGMPQKLLDLRRIHALGWKHKIDLITGIKTVINDFIKKYPFIN